MTMAILVEKETSLIYFFSFCHTKFIELSYQLLGINLKVYVPFMSPSNFNNWFNANELNVNSTGAVNNNNTWNGYGVRPISYYN